MNFTAVYIYCYWWHYNLHAYARISETICYMKYSYFCKVEGTGLELSVVVHLAAWITFSDKFVHSINISSKNHLYRPAANISCVQKSIFCAGIRIFHSLPYNLTSLKNGNAQLKVSFRRYLNTHSFYPVDEFLYVQIIPTTVYKLFIV